MSVTFKLDKAGVGELLKSAEYKAAVEGIAKNIADELRPHVGDAPVLVDTHVTDRVVATVTIADDSGLARQAKDGVLTQAAAAVGFAVRSHK